MSNSRCGTLHSDSMLSLKFTSTIVLRELVLYQGLSWLCSCSVLHIMALFETGPEILFLEFLHECSAVAQLRNTQEGLRIDPAHAWWWMFVEIVHSPTLEMDSYTASPHRCCACAVQGIATLIEDAVQGANFWETDFPFYRMNIFSTIYLIYEDQTCVLRLNIFSVSQVRFIHRDILGLMNSLSKREKCTILSLPQRHSQDIVQSLLLYQ